MNIKGTSLPEQIIYMWLREHFGEENVINRVRIDGIEFDIYVKPLELLIEYGDRTYHNYENDTNVNDIKKMKYAENSDKRLLRILSDTNNKKAYIEDDLIVYNCNEDKYLLRQVLVMISFYIYDNYCICIEPNDMDEKTYASAVANLYQSRFTESFGKKYSTLAECWDLEGNFDINPYKISMSCPHKFIFKCPNCGNKFKSNITDFVRKSTCKCCGYNPRVNDEEIIKLEDVEGVHSNVDCFVVNGEEINCDYIEMIVTLIEDAIINKNVSKLLNAGVIQYANNIVGLKNRIIIKDYVLNIPKNVEEQYNLLIDVIMLLDLKLADFKVKLKQYIFERIKTKKDNSFIDLSSERANQYEMINNKLVRNADLITYNSEELEELNQEEEIEKRNQKLYNKYLNSISNISNKAVINYLDSVRRNRSDLSNNEKNLLAHNTSKSYYEYQRNMFILGMGHLI